MNTRCFFAVLALAFSSGLLAQDRRGELGLRYWLSTGETKHSHNAQVLIPSAGMGRVNKGSFDDEDYNAGQVKFLDTTSVVKEGRISYFTLDVGRYEWSL